MMNARLADNLEPKLRWAIAAAALTAISMAIAMSLMKEQLTSESRHALEEVRMSHQVLTDSQVNMNPQAREYLKGRMYWNASVWVPTGWLDGMNIDLGPVDEGVLAGLQVAKDGSTVAEVYQAAIKKHPKRK